MFSTRAHKVMADIKNVNKNRFLGISLCMVRCMSLPGTWKISSDQKAISEWERCLIINIWSIKVSMFYILSAKFWDTILHIPSKAMGRYKCFNILCLKYCGCKEDFTLCLRLQTLLHGIFIYFTRIHSTPEWFLSELEERDSFHPNEDSIFQWLHFIKSFKSSAEMNSKNILHNEKYKEILFFSLISKFQYQCEVVWLLHFLYLW